ncbi:AAA family ATPase [Deltaproteobacteria bacterium TL4]
MKDFNQILKSDQKKGQDLLSPQDKRGDSNKSSSSFNDPREQVLPFPSFQSAFFHAGQLQGTTPSVDFLVDDFLPTPIVGKVSSTEDAGKTWFLMQVAIAISSGYPFLGRPVGEPANVMMLIGEEDQDDVHRRLNAVRSYYLKPDATDIFQTPISSRQLLLLDHNLEFACLSGLNIQLRPGRVDRENFYDYLRQRIIEFPVRPKLLILDPVHRFFDGDESRLQDTTRFLTLLESIKNLGMSVLFAHRSRNNFESNNPKNTEELRSYFGIRWRFMLSVDNASVDEGTLDSNVSRTLSGKITQCNKFQPRQQYFKLKQHRTGPIFCVPS